MTNKPTAPSLSVDDLLARLTNVKKSGGGWTARCPAHEDKQNSLSLTVGDDGKILMKCHAGCVFQDIIGAMGIEAQQLFPAKPEQKPEQTQGRGKIVKTYDYTDLAGNLLYQAVRFEPKDFNQRRPDPDKPGKWIWNLKGIKPTLYNLPKLLDTIKKGRTVFVVEGEKDVENLAGIGVTATCNSGGAGKWSAAFSQYFTGAKVVIIEDNDDAGTIHTARVGKYLSKVVAEIRVIEFPDTKDHYDVSDWIQKGHNADDLKMLVLAAPLWEPEPEPEKNEGPKLTPDYVVENPPFRILGSCDGIYTYMPAEDLQIVSLSADQHTKPMLMSFAPLNWWESCFPAGRTKGADWDAARNWMYRMSKKKPIYNVKRVRGCGAWFDKGRVVQHNGNHLIVDGVKTDIHEFKTTFIYNASYPLEPEKAEPLDTSESSKFLAICRMPSWEKPISGTLLAGWCVVATICGTLPWRPHIWLTGVSGSGKTWCLDNLIKPMLGSIALQVQSNTTEAGIRQALGSHAFPVVFDESEGEDQQARKRLQGVIELARQASSETGAPIIKGSTMGNAMMFMIRSCFLLSSVGVNIGQRADASRISVLTLTKPHPKDAVDLFDELKTMVAATITKQYCASMRARALKLVPVILSNSLIFGREVAYKFSDQRIGDQFGVLLAGAYSLKHDGAVTPKNASAWIEAQDWSEQAAIEDMTDEDRCMSQILQHVISYQVDSHRVERSIGEMLYKAIDIPLTTESAEALERTGIRVHAMISLPPRAVFAESHRGISLIMKDTPWQKNWSRILKRIDGHEKKTARFGGKVMHAVSIPIDTIMGILPEGRENEG